MANGPIRGFVRTLNEVPSRLVEFCQQLEIKNKFFLGETEMAISKEEVLEAISSMSVLDLSELIKEMEEKFGVSAAAMAVAAAPASGAGGAALPIHQRSKQNLQ